MSKMDITPHVNLLRSLRAERIVYEALIGEGVDNALDAGARNIDVSIESQAVQFADDGCGIPRSRLKSLFSLGEHGALTTTQLGRFGVGIKAQAVNAGNIMGVVSTSKEGRIATEVNWRDLLRSGIWEINEPVAMPVAVGASTGTVITIKDLRIAPRVTMDRLVNDVASRFYPALEEGKTIRLNNQQIPLLAEPQMTDIVDVNLSLSGGRGAHLRAGILVNPSSLNRIHVAYRHRVIMPSSTVGAGEYGGGLNKMFARIQLAGAWHLAKFKDDLPDEEERGELEEAVLDQLAPILEKCCAASISAKLSEMTARVNDLVPDRLSPRRPWHLNPKKPVRRGKKLGKHGFVEEDRSDDNGPAKSPRQSMPKNTLLITFDGNNTEHGVGVFRPGRINRVELARDNPFVSELLNLRDQKMAARAIVAISFAIYEQGICIMEPELPYLNFGQRIANHLRVDEAATLAKTQ